MVVRAVSGYLSIVAKKKKDASLSLTLVTVDVLVVKIFRG